MKSSEKQYLEEKQVLDCFLSVVEVKGSVISKSAHQIPDVLIENGSNIIGIEITEIKNKEPRIEGRYRDIARSLESKLHFKFDGVVDINIIFPSIEISIKEKAVLENEIITSIERSISTEAKDRVFELKISGKYSSCISIYIFRTIKAVGEEFKARVHVNCVEAGWENQNPEEIVKKAIERKNQKYIKYIENCDECWLLIYANPRNKESHFNFSKLCSIRYKSLFKRTFVMDLFKPQEIVEICKLKI